MIHDDSFFADCLRIFNFVRNSRIWFGAKECGFDRPQRMLESAPLVAIWSVDTAENGPNAYVCCKAVTVRSCLEPRRSVFVWSKLNQLRITTDSSVRSRSSQHERVFELGQHVRSPRLALPKRGFHEALWYVEDRSTLRLSLDTAIITLNWTRSRKALRR